MTVTSDTPVLRVTPLGQFGVVLELETGEFVPVPYDGHDRVQPHGDRGVYPTFELAVAALKGA